MPPDHKPLASNHFEHCPHCQGQMLTEQQLEQVAEKAAIKAVELFRNQFYRGVGAAVVGRALWLIGAMTLAVALWLSSRGVLK